MSEPSSARPMRAAVLTVSDRCSRGAATDTSGPACAALLRDRLGATVVATRCLPDEMDALSACFLEWSAASLRIDLIVSTGGTGLAPRDVTPEAARRVFEREHPGLMELARHRCLVKTPLALFGLNVGLAVLVFGLLDSGVFIRGSGYRQQEKLKERGARTARAAMAG